MLKRLYNLAFAFILVCGAGCAPSFLVTPVSSSTALREQMVKAGSGLFPRKIVIIEVEGLLLNARSGGLLQPQENDVSRFAQQLDKAAADDSVAAVVLRVNSPGGTVSASDAMYDTLLRFRKNTHKPVVAAAQDVAASGAYYVSCAADQFVVQPTSVVGSIGVIFSTFDISGTLAKVGARTEAIKSGPFKDMGSPFRAMNSAERDVMQAMVDEYYQRFKAVVRSGRGIDQEQIIAVSDGRVFTGEQAVKLHLADRTGMLEDAIDLAKELGKAPGAKVVLYKRPYGYSGSIYAAGEGVEPRSNVIQLNLAPDRALLPTGFYYLWDPS
jgi:protease IV